MQGGRRRIDRVLAPELLEDLQGSSLEDVRAHRAEAEAEEAVLSYERRLLHGKMDILRAELSRRQEGGGGSLVDRLTKILADDRGPSRGQFPREVEVPDFENSKRRIERLVSDDTLARVPDMADAEIEEIIGRLSEAEQEVSDSRRKVQQVLDALTAEVARRYKSGEADPTDVLRGG